jgi:hypothetical protein
VRRARDLQGCGQLEVDAVGVADGVDHDAESVKRRHFTVRDSPRDDANP